ncbi:MAG TPA: hypothetical protein VG097_03320 [Gemmata sp.]|jgi:hypothetical protein|nr:hypothetical protein [Gemmata sp.]
MFTKIVCVTFIGLIGTTLSARDGDRQLKIIGSKAIPAIESITVYQTKNGKRESVAELSKLDKPHALPEDGPYEIFAKPTGGIPIKIAEKVSVKSGQTHELKLGDLIGSVEVFGDNFPRADKIVLTDERDPGPGEKGHVPVQIAKDYRVEMAAPPGFYSVWVIPANGAKAQRVVDSVRVMGGKLVRVGD